MMRLRLTGTCVLVLAIFVFTGSALAGNGQGNGNGNDNGGAGAAAPGNSGNAPGQVKKDAPAPAPVGTVQTTATTPADASAGPTEGVKPASDTAHDTHAPASSNSTKQYGNGQTAGAIAIKNGAAPSTTLHGPGNSQPHKAAPCSGRHEVDVHALKAHHAAACGGTPTPHPAPSPTPSPTPPGPGPTSKPEPKPAGHPVTDPGQHHSAQPAEKTVRHAHGNSASRGVLSATHRTAELPFTGLSLWIAVLAGCLMLGAGLVLRQIRTAEAAVESGHDHPDRARHAARRARAAVRSRSGR
jgi:hypothetical protein